MKDDRFCLDRFIALEAVDGAPLLCGHSSLEKEIVRINVIEDTDLAMWSDPGDVILSSGYLFWKDPQLLMQTLPVLRETGVVALALKPDRADKHIPAGVVARATELDFPLIQLSPTAVFANIVYEARDIILRSREASLLQVQRQSQQILEKLLHATTPVECLEMVEASVDGNPVFAYSNDNELIVTPASSTLLYDSLQGDFVSRLRKMGARGGPLLLTVGGQVRAVKAHFYGFEGQRGCSLAVLEYHRPLQAGELDVLGRVTPVLALEISNALVMKKVRRKYKDRFIKDLIAGKLGKEADICTVAEAQGYRVYPQCQYRVAVIMPQSNKHISFTEADIGVISHYCRTLEVMMAFTLLDGYLVLVFEDSATSPCLHLLKGLEQHIRRALRKGRVRFCISEAYGLTEIPEAYQEAIRFQKISTRCQIEDTFITCEKLGVLAVLSLLPQNKSTQRFRQSLLQPLKEYDAAHHTNLQKTLEVYLASHCNAKLTAQRMFTHYNTIIYRLERVRDIGGYDLDDAEQILQLQIAIKMDMIQPAGG